MHTERITKALKGLVRRPGIPDDPVEDDMVPWRQRIDQIDQILLALLNERARCGNIIGNIKKKLGLPVYVPKREEEVLEQVMKENKGPLPDPAVRNLFERIIDEIRSLERQKYQDESDT